MQLFYSINERNKTIITSKERRAIIDALTKDFNDGFPKDHPDYLSRDSFEDTVDRALKNLKKKNEEIS